MAANFSPQRHRGTEIRKVFYVFVSLCFCASLAHSQEMITVAVASSYAEKANVYSQAFEQTYDVKVRLVSGATGRLYNQIKQGAPFDIFITAGIKYPAMLKAKHKRIGSGYLGIQVWDKLSGLQVLQQSRIKHIAIANPDIAPFGLAAKAVLQSQGLWELLKPKLVYAQNAMQAAMMVNQGLTDAGFVPIADKTHALATVPYVAVLLSKSKQAQAFYKSLSARKTVIPAKAGIHQGIEVTRNMDSRLRGNDNQ